MTSKLTRERLEKIKSWRETYGAGSNVMLPAEEAEALALIALAAMDSEPVVYISKSDFDTGYPHILARRDFNKACTMPVYAAQPAPVVPEEATSDSIEILASARRRDHAVFQWDEDQRNAAADSWNACRAAMLERQLVDRVDEKSLTSINPAPDLVSLQKKAESIIGNYPGIPDGYVMAPVEPNGDMLAAAQDAYGETDGDIASTLRAAMLAAAQQEGK
ncbi:hypothetical protein [Klebsiella quasipneumoniae]|uniref:hypothetical protein n=1 Tax=Klebsiella quasipneumoniae TaxID=1463165 RepID=UPI0021C31733|nr:hypothetical protein [Klebsiella quasipneumoniae]